MNNPKFSVVIPVYNVEKYLPQCVDSILAQNYSNLELILVADETSEDRSTQIAREYAASDERVVVKMRAHMGVGDARNFGAEFCNGDYLIFVDSDDYIDSTSYFDEIASCISTHEPEYVITRLKKYDDNTRTTFEFGKPWKEEIIHSSDFERKMSYVLDSGCYCISVWAKAIKRSFFEEKQLQFPPGYCEDIEWTARMLNAAKNVEILNNDSYTYRIREGSLSHDQNVAKRLYALQEKILFWDGLLKGDSEYVKAQRGYISYQYFIYLASVFLLSGKEKKKAWQTAVELKRFARYARSHKTRACRVLCETVGYRIGGFLLSRYILIGKH